MNNRLRYLRVSLLNHCNLSCFYCKPPSEGVRKTSRADSSTLMHAISALHGFGVRKVRFTGGEPTLHRDLCSLVKSTKALSHDTFCALTSNGMLLNKLAQPLSDSGLDSLNISLDTLSPEKFKKITNSDSLDKVISGIYESVGMIPEVKINCVMMNGVNDDEAVDMIEFANKLGIDIRFIEYMPTRFKSDQKDMYISGDAIRDTLPFVLKPVPSSIASAARYFSSESLKIRVGFINAVSHSFCAHCDRIRLTSDGNLYGCLFSGQTFNLFNKLEDGLTTAHESLKSLLDSKQFIGCSGAGQSTDNLPSFVDMGG